MLFATCRSALLATHDEVDVGYKYFTFLQAEGVEGDSDNEEVASKQASEQRTSATQTLPR